MTTHRRDFLNLVGIGAGLLGSTVLTSLPVFAQSAGQENSAAAPTPASELPPRKRVEGRITFQNEDNLVVENLHVDGTLRILGCENATIRNVVVSGSNSFSSMVCRNSPGTKFYDTFLHEGQGHGLFRRGNIEGIEAHRLQSFDNKKDGIQVSDDALGTATFFDTMLINNVANAVDMKGGSLVFNGGRMEGAGDELLLTNKSAKSLLLDGTRLISNSKKPFVRLSAGTVELRNVGFAKGTQFRWFWVDKNVYHKGLDFEVGGLKVVDGFDYEDTGAEGVFIGTTGDSR